MPAGMPFFAGGLRRAGGEALKGLQRGQGLSGPVRRRTPGTSGSSGISSSPGRSHRHRPDLRAQPDPAAVWHVQEGRVRGKVVITI
jgi:hypothetical protein